mgnify:FL=1
MKDKKTLITIIVLLAIILPMGVYGTINSYSTTKNPIKDDNPNKDFIYNNKLYFYKDNTLISTYECSTCSLATTTYNDTDYHTNSYQNESTELSSIINDFYGIFKENNDIVLYNLKNSKKVDTYKSIKTYDTKASSNFGIVEKNTGWGVVFFDLSHSTIPSTYNYIAIPSHYTNNILDSSKFITNKDGIWQVLKDDNTTLFDNVTEEIVDFNDNYYITYTNNTYHIYDKDKIEYLPGLPKTNVYGVGKYLFILYNRQLFIYENCLNPVLKILEISNYDKFYFNVNEDKVDIMVDGKSQETIELS